MKVYLTVRPGCWKLLGPVLLWVGLITLQSLSANTAQASRLYSYMDGNGVLHVTNIPLNAASHGYLAGRTDKTIYAMDGYSSMKGCRGVNHGCQKWRYPLQTSRDIAGTIARAALHHGLDPDFVGAVVKIESGGAVRAISARGAKGLMQLMPGTARELGIVDPFDPIANIWGGTRYLKMLLTRFDGDVILALAAYNAGPGRVERCGGVPPFRETREYIRRVIYQWKENRANKASR